MEMSEYIQVATTVETKTEAVRIAHLVVERRLAACVQILGPVMSVYWWKEEIQQAHEWICLLKSRADLYEELESTIQQVHSYETPEVLVVSIVNGSSDYLNWLENSLKK